MTGALLLGAGFGLGLLAIAWALKPRKPSLAEALAAISRQPSPPPIAATDTGGWAARLGRPAVTVLAGLGLPSRPVRRDLAILGRTADRLLAEQATAAITGLLIVPATAVLVAGAGVALPWQLPAAGALALSVAGFTVPAFAVRHEAAARRAGFRHALAAYLDLIVISTAGGAGIEAALTHSAAAGGGWAFTQLRQALETARLTRRPPADCLAQLGRRGHHLGRNRRRQSKDQPRREGRHAAQPATRPSRDSRPGRNRADEPAAGAAFRRVPRPDRLPGDHPRPDRPIGLP